MARSSGSHSTEQLVVALGNNFPLKCCAQFSLSPSMWCQQQWQGTGRNHQSPLAAFTWLSTRSPHHYGTEAGQYFSNWNQRNFHLPPTIVVWTLSVPNSLYNYKIVCTDCTFSNPQIHRSPAHLLTRKLPPLHRSSTSNVTAAAAAGCPDWWGQHVGISRNARAAFADTASANLRMLSKRWFLHAT